MIHFEAFLSCILITAIGSATGFPAPDAPFSFRADAMKPTYKDIVGPSFPNDTEYVTYNASRYPLALSIVDVGIFNQYTFEDCKYEATSRGGDIFEFDAPTGKCNIATLQFPLCKTRQGTVPIYIQPQFLTDGTVNDGTIVANLHVGVLLWSSLSDPGAGYGTFRVQAPTILAFPDYYNSAGSISKQTIFTENNSLVSVDSDILVDPVCYTNSSCGVPFAYPLPTRMPNVKMYDKICGGAVVTITLGQPLYLLSHSGIGCMLFPNSGYGSGTCSVTYRGYSSTGVNITVALVNFVDGDKCDGFNLSVLTYNTQTNTTSTKFCTTDVTTVHSPVARGRFDFSGISKTMRPKYGFIIKLVDA